MDALGKVKTWIGGLTEIGLMLLALAIVAALLVGSNLPFFGNVTGNIMAPVKSLLDAGLVELIALGVGCFVTHDGVATRFLGSNTCDRDDVGWRALSHPTRCRRARLGRW
jgi:hypothetical protein